MINNLIFFKHFKSLKLLLNKKEIIKLIYILVFTFLNIFFELLGIGLIIPLLEIMLNYNENSFFLQYIENLNLNINKDNLLFYILTLFFFSFILKNIITIYINYLLTDFRFSIMSNLSDKIYTDYLKKDFAFLRNSKKISLVKDIIEESSNVSQNIIFQFLNIISDSILIGSVIIFLFFTFTLETLYLSIYFFTMGIIYYYFVKKKLIKLGASRYDQLEKRYQSLLDGFSSFIQIKLSNKESNFLSKFKVFNKNFFKISLKYSVYQILPKYLFEISFAIFFILMIFIARQIEYSFNSLIILISVYAVAGLKLLPSISRIFVSIQSMSYAIPALEKFKQKLNNKNGNSVRNEKLIEKEIQFNQILTIQNLNFSYPEKEVLKNLNFEVTKGSIVGFKGPSGSGKSTLFYILLGLMKPSSGNIKIDSEEANLNSTSWMKKIGYLGSNTYLLDETIKQNIIFSEDEENINIRMLENSIQFSELSKLIEDLPNGLDTYLGDDGTKISTGQKQRIGLARLFFSNKPIIFLDEATNSLDKSTEKKIFENLRLLDQNTTKFIISHDNANLDLCDKVIDIK